MSVYGVIVIRESHYCTPFDIPKDVYHFGIEAVCNSHEDAEKMIEELINSKKYFPHNLEKYHQIELAHSSGKILAWDDGRSDFDDHHVWYKIRYSIIGKELA